MNQLADLALLGLDANAWLAKGQPVIDGGVILVHGNGNEHVGIELLMEELDGWAPHLFDGSARFVSPIQVLAPLSPR